MKLYETGLTRADYLRTQIERSDAKFNYCKVSVHDVARYAAIIDRSRRRERNQASVGPVVCLGTRNGREIDLFRTEFFGPRWRRRLSAVLERRTHSFTTWCTPLEAIGRSDVNRIAETSVLGVEVNPRAARSDVWIGSFDEMPSQWSGRFGIVYSNSFDQSEDPERTATEWARIMRPGGYLIFCFSNQASPTVTDPVGGLTLADVCALFPGELVYFQHRGSQSGYSEAIVRQRSESR